MSLSDIVRCFVVFATIRCCCRIHFVLAIQNRAKRIVISYIYITMNKAETWDFCALEYDTTAEAVTSPCVTKLLEQVSILPPPAASNTINVIDVAAGPGFLGTILGDAYSQAGLLEKMTLLSTDFSPKMVEIAERRFASRNWPSSKFSSRTLDAANLVDVPSDHFTHAFCTFGIMMVPDYSKALNEMYRVLQPSGIIGITTWHTVGWMPIVSEAVARVKALSPQDKNSAMPSPVLQGWTDTLYIQKVLEDAGFHNVQVNTFESQWSFKNHDDCIQQFTQGRVMTSLLQAANLTDEQREKYNQVLREVLLDMVNKNPDESFHLPMIAILAHGQKPAI